MNVHARLCFCAPPILRCPANLSNFSARKLVKETTNVLRYLAIGALLTGVAGIASASPLLTITVDSTTLLGTGATAYVKYLDGGFGTSKESINDFLAASPADRRGIAGGSILHTQSLGLGDNQVEVEQFANPGLIATASSSLVTNNDREIIEEVVSGTWTLSETASVRLDIDLESIMTQATAGGASTPATASATVKSIFNVDQFTNQTLTGLWGPTVTAQAPSGSTNVDVEGGGSAAGPNSETKLIQAGSYKYNMTFFVAANAVGSASSVANLGNAGFMLTVVPSTTSPEPGTFSILGCGIALFAVSRYRLRKWPGAKGHHATARGASAGGPLDGFRSQLSSSVQMNSFEQ
jgi:hypothetical protein